MLRTLFAMIAALLSLSAAQGQTSIHIDESKIRAVLKKDSTGISVPIESSADHAIKAQLSLAWLDKDERESGALHQNVSLQPGKSDIEIPLQLSAPSIWTRLRYSLVPDRAEARSFGPINGVVSLSHIADYIFELKLSFAESARSGSRVTVFGEAVHPVTRVPILGIEWSAKLLIDKQELVPVRTDKNDEGFVEFVFDLPESNGVHDKAAEIQVVGRLGDFEQKASLMISLISSRLSGSFQSDKPIYQPDQTMHLRAIIQDADGKAAQGAKVILRIDAEDNERVHTARLISSKFGIVQDEWMIPAGAALGLYWISIDTDNNVYYVIADHIVRVSRYELPTFTLTAKPDRPAYLPTEQPRITVTGKYLFGKPVPNGQVKIVRMSEPRWNPTKHKSESSEETVAEGNAGEDGVFVTQLDLKADYENLQASEYNRFGDLHFAAYYKDVTSGRTEQRRFDVRISREPIHIYFIRTNGGGSLPYAVYVSTSYADGQPASAAVEIPFHGRTTSLHTNRYGIGKAFLTDNDDKKNGLEEDVVIKATDAAGRTGKWRERYWSRGTELFRLETSHTIYRIGESVKLDITAPQDSPADQFVLIHAMSDNRRIASRVVRLTNHKGQVTFPYQAEFQRKVVFVAWSAADPRDDYHAKALGSKTVIFPESSELNVSATTEQGTYRPGEKASLQVKVASADGKPVQAALGLAVVDQAVLERARTDSEFGQRAWFSCAFCRDKGENEIGGVRLNDLYALKPGSTISPELDLVAEALVAGDSGFIPSASSESVTRVPEFKLVASQMQKLTADFDDHYMSTLDFPQDVSSLAEIPRLQWTQLRDPWGTPYFAKFKIERQNRVITILSAGPDKRLGTEDDFVVKTLGRPYFTAIRHLIDEALKKQDYPATDREFENLLRDNGILFGSLRDPWGSPYEANVTMTGLTRRIRITCAGPDRIFGTRDDFPVAELSGSYFDREKAEISAVLQNAAAAPQSIEEFQKLLASAGINLSNYRDAWGRPYHVLATVSSRYDDRINFTTSQVFGQPPTLRQDVVPVTRSYIVFSLHSVGADGTENTYDDFNVAQFSVLLKEESARPEAGLSPQPPAMLPGTGVITGTVTDASGAVLPQATVMLITAAGASYETFADQSGIFRFASVPAGLYSLKTEMPGFQTHEISKIPVTEGKTIRVDIELKVAGVATQIEVSSAFGDFILEASSTTGTVLATPRVRDYFPETLLWIPEMITDANGLAHTEIPLADTVTTWKIAAVASTLDGRIAEAENDFRTFQPFFLDFNPPLVLTEGDQVELPVAVRNYRDQAQKVSINIAPNDWSAVQGSSTRQVTVPANQSVNVTYSVQAKKANEKAAQRITAIAGRDRDAIEKSSRVHPDGQEVTRTSGDLVAGPTSFTVVIPQSAIAGATRGELRIYPNIASMLLESASAILSVPHGCVEQTISAGYANLIAWRFAQAAGVRDPQIEKRALANIRFAVEGLGAFSNHDGGIRYWSTGDSDVAVTAYALAFLIEASAIVPVDKEDLSALVTWLQKYQATDGMWKSRNTGSVSPDRQDLLLTGTVARSLAAAQKSGIKVSSSTLSGAYHHIAKFTDSVDEPYMLANFILAALDSGDEALLGDAVSRLAALAREERGGVYWDLQTNSPFYGWGTAGRYETTGLAVSALSAWRATHQESKELDAQIRRGLVFLLRGRDRMGMWFSTQSTLRVMRAMGDSSLALGSIGSPGGTIEIRSNRGSVKAIKMPDDPKALDPITADLSSFLFPGENQITLATTSGMQAGLILFSSTYWLPWNQTKPRSSPELRLDVRFDRLEMRAGDPVRCTVKAERMGFRGYGMMLAEIGLPPGAEVDRGSLESLIENDSSGVDHYEVLPDRVVLYLWPRAGGSSFDFFISARTAMNAKSAPSVLYDYYNPEALSELPPFRWIVK